MNTKFCLILAQTKLGVHAFSDSVIDLPLSQDLNISEVLVFPGFGAATTNTNADQRKVTRFESKRRGKRIGILFLLEYRLVKLHISLSTALHCVSNFPFQL